MAAAVCGGLGLGASAAAAAPSPGTGDVGFYTYRPAGRAAGARVNVASGDLLVTAHDLADSRKSHHVVVDRFYNSLDPPEPRALGPRWRLSVGPDVSLVDHGSTVTLTGPSGYVVTLADTGSGTYAGPAGFDGLLTRTASGWQLQRPVEHDSLRFDGTGALVGRADAAGRAFTVHTTSAGGRTRLSSYGIPDGPRARTFAYAGGGPIRRLTDPAGGHHTYRYSGHRTGDLNRYGDPSGRHTTYAYDDLGHLSEIHAPDGTFVDIASDRQGRVVLFTVTSPDGTSQQSTIFHYGDHTTGVTNPAGHLTVYTYDDDFRVTGAQTDRTPPPPPTNLDAEYDPGRGGAEFGWFSTGTDGGGYTDYRYSVNAGPYVGYEQAPFDYDAFADQVKVGDHVTLQVRSHDKWGNVSKPASATFRMVDPDTEPGVIPQDAQPPGRSRRRCRHRGERVVKRGAEAEVVAGGAVGQRAVMSSRAFLCRYKDKRRVRLGTDDDRLTVSTMRLAGLFVAFEDAFGNGGHDDATMLVLRSLDGVHHRYVIDTGDAAASTLGVYTGIELSAKGSVGFIRGGGTRPAGVFRCQPVGCDHGPERLDGATGLKQGSLRRTRRGFGWVRNGKRRFATLR